MLGGVPTWSLVVLVLALMLLLMVLVMRAMVPSGTFRRTQKNKQMDWLI